MIRFIKHILIVAGLISATGLFGQTTVKVVTRKIEQQWESKANQKLIISAEKAKITIEKATGTLVQVQLKLIAKHKDLDIAKKELGYIKHNISSKPNDIYLNNRILLPKKVSSTEARLSVEYLIKVPENVEISVTNSIGTITIRNMSGDFTLIQKYGNIHLQNISGTLKINSHIGDIEGNNLHTHANIYAEYSEISLENIQGNYKLNTRFGNLNILPANKLESIDIDAYKTDTYIFNHTCQEFNLNCELQYGRIKASLPCYIKQESALTEYQAKENLTQIKYLKKGNLPEINIQSKFADVNLR